MPSSSLPAFTGKAQQPHKHFAHIRRSSLAFSTCLLPRITLVTVLRRRILKPSISWWPTIMLQGAPGAWLEVNNARHR